MQRQDLTLLPRRQAEAFAASGAPIYVFINPPENHGPHMPLQTDHLLSEALSVDLHAQLLAAGRDWPMLTVLPLHAGAGPTPGNGTVHTSARQLRQMVLATCKGLVRLGAKRVILMTFHGYPLHNLAIHAGVEWLQARGIRAVAPFHAIVREMIAGSQSALEEVYAPISDPAVRATVRDNALLDFHAGFHETSLMLHYRPESVAPDYQTLPPCPEYPPAPVLAKLSRLAQRLGREELAHELMLGALGEAWMALKPFPGYTGWPHLANATTGAHLARHIVERYLHVVAACFAEPHGEQLEPIFGWARPLVALQ